MRNLTKTRGLAVAAVASLSLLTTACGSGDSTGEVTPTEETTSAEASATMDPAANLVGPGCADYAEQVPDGAGSVDGMAQDPVATAASNNPLLKTLTQAVTGELNPDVDLASTLNSGEYTVFAPTDDAFGKLDAETVKTLSSPEGAETLQSILTYHVIQGQIAPSDIDGTHTTLNGADVEVTGSGDNIEVGGQAAVICGGVQTANATVYLIDTVLTPPAS